MRSRLPSREGGDPSDGRSSAGAAVDPGAGAVSPGVGARRARPSDRSGTRAAGRDAGTRLAGARAGHAGLSLGPGGAPAHARAALDPGADRRGGGLARAAGPAGRHHAHLRARHPSRADAGEHPGRAVSPDQALRRHRARPEGAPLAAARVGDAGRHHAGHPGPGGHRPGAGAQGGGARDAGDRHAEESGAAAPRGPGLRVRRHRRGAGRLRLGAAAAAGDAGDARLHERGAAQAHEAHRAPAELRPGRAGGRRRPDRGGEGAHHRGRGARRLPPPSPCPRSTRSGGRRTSWCCRTSAACTRGAITSWPGSSSTTSSASSRASLSARRWSARADTEA